MINTLYSDTSVARIRDRVGFLILLMLFTLGYAAKAQQGSQGNTTIFASEQMTFFGNHNFITGGAGLLPGIILTERATATISYLNFSGANLTTTGASNANYVDGYVRKYGTGPFIFPTGDNGTVGQFAADADGISGAYYFANPSTAVTNNVFTGTNYGPLPAGGPFSTASKVSNVESVSAVEYWDINGSVTTPLTLTWRAGSNIGALTNSSLIKLTIVGWNVNTGRWEVVPSKFDITSVLGGASDLTTGSITTSANIIPNTYSVYTLASVAKPDLTPAQFFSSQNIGIGESIDYVVAISNVGQEATSDLIAFQVTNVTASSGLVITPSTATSLTIDGDVFPLNNAEFNIATSSLRFSLTSKPGVVIAPSAYKFIGFKITRTAGAIGALNNTVTVTDNTGGGEAPVDNNRISNSINKL